MPVTFAQHRDTHCTGMAIAARTNPVFAVPMNALPVDELAVARDRRARSRQTGDRIAYTTSVHVDGDRLLIHVTRDALEVLGAHVGDETTLLSTLAANMAEISRVAIHRHRAARQFSVEFSDADARLLIARRAVAGPSGRQNCMSGGLEVLQVRAAGGRARLDPSFVRGCTDYRVEVASDVQALHLRAAPWIGGARIVIDGVPAPPLLWHRKPLRPGHNVAFIEVEHPGSGKTAMYRVHIQRDDATALIQRFVSRTFVDRARELRMPYRLFVPERRDAATPHPLVIFLNGGDAAGDDNEAQLWGTRGATIWAEPAEQRVRPAFVLAPQSRPAWGSARGEPPGGFGLTRNTAGERCMDRVLEPTVDLRLALQVVEQVLAEFPDIDRRRIYITGVSQGGFGTWAAAMLHSARFAAAVPVAGGGDPDGVGTLVDLPIWAFHAQDDPVIPVHYTSRCIDALRRAGGRPRFTCYPSGTFFDPHEHCCWVDAYADDQMRAWLFAQART